MAIENDPTLAMEFPTFKQRKQWPAFLAGLLLGAGIAVGVFLAIQSQPGWLNFGGRNSRNEVSHTPTSEEVLDYLDGKSFIVPSKEGKEKGMSVVIRQANVSEVKWDSGSRIGGDENPWTHRYSCLYADGKSAFILDVSVKVRSVGARRAFLGLGFDGVTPVDKVVVPRN